jgi:hypothetical protein
MQEGEKKDSVPEFRSGEREDEFWRRLSSPGQADKRPVQRKPEKRSSYLALRLTGEELARLREAARKADVGPTTLARKLILKGLQEENALLQRIEALEQKVASLGRPSP